MMTRKNQRDWECDRLRRAGTPSQSAPYAPNLRFWEGVSEKPPGRIRAIAFIPQKLS
ncbi:hypothetical protein [Nostoc sp.]